MVIRRRKMNFKIFKWHDRETEKLISTKILTLDRKCHYLEIGIILKIFICNFCKSRISY